MTNTQIDSVDGLITEVLQNRFELDPAAHPVVGAFAVQQSTRFPGADKTYRNHYLLVRVGMAFGGCCVEPAELGKIEAESLAGQSIAALLEHPQLPVRIAALDAYFGICYPHRDSENAQVFQLPLGTPVERAIARDEAIVSLLDITPGQKVGLIGVVNPIVDEIEKRGGQCLPCDFNLDKTASGVPVVKDMTPVLAEADMVIATGMTLSNGSFDKIVAAARKREIPLLIYAQTGSAIAARFLGKGVSAVCAEPFPYSQFSAEPSPVYLYQLINLREA
jgi:hypothetical protein